MKKIKIKIDLEKTNIFTGRINQNNKEIEEFFDTIKKKLS
jgi:hypothetical protein